MCAIQAVLGSIPGGDQIFLILYCFKKAFERERIYLIFFVVVVVVQRLRLQGDLELPELEDRIFKLKTQDTAVSYAELCRDCRC